MVSGSQLERLAPRIDDYIAALFHAIGDDPRGTHKAAIALFVSAIRYVLIVLHWIDVPKIDNGRCKAIISATSRHTEQNNEQESDAHFSPSQLKYMNALPNWTGKRPVS
jgi:hypothetical protein